MPSNMDKAIAKPGFSASRLVVPLVLAVVVVAGVWYVIDRSGSSRLRVDATRLTTAVVESGQFREYYPFDGTVEPVTTVFLDIESGGRVDEIFVEGGHHIEEGNPILRFSNVNLQRSSIDTETRLIEQLNQLRNTQFNLAQSELLLKDSLLELDFRILNTEKTYERYAKLVELDSGGGISREAFENVRDELEYLREKRVLLVERIEQERILSQQQLEQAERSIQGATESLDLLDQIVESLLVRAPITGFLSSINAQIGQNINSGQRIGQIDILDDYKISVSIDQFYISQVAVGTRGKFELDGVEHAVVVTKVYPEVVNNAFIVDTEVEGALPASLRRGQRLTIELSFSEATQSLMVSKGGFYQQTSGRWVYLINEDGSGARKTTIRLGRQNPRFVEVQEGLREGDWIITSGYDAFNEVDELRFAEAIAPLD